MYVVLVSWGFHECFFSWIFLFHEIYKWGMPILADRPGRNSCFNWDSCSVYNRNQTLALQPDSANCRHWVVCVGWSQPSAEEILSTKSLHRAAFRKLRDCCLHHCSIKWVKHVGSLPVAGLNKELKHFQISLLKAELLEGNCDCLLCFQSLVFIWPLWAIRILITLIITGFNPSSALYLFSVLGELDLPVCFPSVKLR